MVRQSDVSPQPLAAESQEAQASAPSVPLCIGYLGADWWGSDARAMAIEFRRQGHLLLERHYEDYLPTRWVHPALRALRRVLRVAVANEYNRSIKQLLGVGGLDFLLVFKGMLLKPTTLAKFKERGIPCYCFYPDVSFDEHGRNIAKCLPYYDCVFTAKTYHLEDTRLRELTAELVYAPHGFDPDVHRPVGRDSMELKKVFGADVSFVGTWSPKKEKIIGALLRNIPDLELKLWGSGWHHASKHVGTFWQGRSAFGDELAAIYSLSRINLGLLSESGTNTVSGDRTTARTWQIPGAGGFLLHEDTSEVREAFQVGTEIAVFDSVESLTAAVVRYLSDEKPRAAIAVAGYRRANSVPYTYARSVEIILDYHMHSKYLG